MLQARTSLQSALERNKSTASLASLIRSAAQRASCTSLPRFLSHSLIHCDEQRALHPFRHLSTFNMCTQTRAGHGRVLHCLSPLTAVRPKLQLDEEAHEKEQRPRHRSCATPRLAVKGSFDESALSVRMRCDVYARARCLFGEAEHRLERTRSELLALGCSGSKAKRPRAAKPKRD